MPRDRRKPSKSGRPIPSAVGAAHKRGRPSKFGRPSRLVALTLPEDTIEGLRELHPDLAWAIVALLEKRQPMANGNPRAEAELVGIGEAQSLIVIDRSTYKGLPGVDIIPLAADRAFLALEPGAGISDLDIAVRNRLESPTIGGPEQHALVRLRARLRAWRRDRRLRFHTRTIIVVEQLPDALPTPAGRANAAHPRRPKANAPVKRLGR